MDKTKVQFNQGFWGSKVMLTKSKDEEMNYNKLNKQVEELVKRVSHLEGVVKHLQQEPKNANMKVSSGSTAAYAKTNNYVNIKPQAVNLTQTNNNQTAQVKPLDKTQKAAQINKEMKLVIQSSPTITIPTKATTTAASSYSSNRNQVHQPIVSKTSTSIRLEPFASKSTTSVSKKPITIPTQNEETFNSKGLDGLQDSPVKSAAKRYEDLVKTQTNLSRNKSQSATDLLAIQNEKRQPNSVKTKNQLTLVPMNKEFLSSSLSTNRTDANRGPPSAPPLPKSPSATNASASSLGQRSTQVATPTPKNDTNNTRREATGLVSKDENSHDMLMDQLKQFADKGFPFKRQITKQSDTHSNTWSFSKNKTGQR